MNGHHPLGSAVEGHLGQSRVIPLQSGRCLSGFFGGDQQGRFGRVAKHRVPARRALDVGVVTQRADPQGQRQVRIDAGIDGPAALAELPDRSVATAGDLDVPAIQNEDAYRHLVLGQCPRLVRADHGGRAERLDGG